MAVTQIEVADVEAWLIDANAEGDLDADILGRLIDAVYAHATDHYDLEDAGDDTDDTRDQALIMETARLWQRKYSTGGYIGADELGQVRVLMFDSDVRKLLADRLITAGIFGPSANTET